MSTLFSEIPNCQDCGACCSHHTNVFVAGNDPNLRFLRDKNLLERIDEGFVMKETDDGVCVALTGEIGKSVSCSVYENRPTACRSYTPGAGQCEIARLFTFGVNRANLTKPAEKLASAYAKHTEFYNDLTKPTEVAR